MVPVHVGSLEDGEPVIDEVDQVVMLRHGLGFALEVVRLVRALPEPVAVRCIVGAKETTREGTEIRLRMHVYPHLGNRWLSVIKPSNIREWDRTLQKKGLAETYRRLIFANVSTIFSAAIDDERLNKNPCTAKSVTPPRGEYPKCSACPSTARHGRHRCRARCG